MRLRNLAAKVGGSTGVGTALWLNVRFLASRIVRHERHVVFEAILDTAPDDVPWSAGEAAEGDRSRERRSAIGADLREFLGGDEAPRTYRASERGTNCLSWPRRGVQALRVYSVQHRADAYYWRTQGRTIDRLLLYRAGGARAGLYREGAEQPSCVTCGDRGYRRVVIETAPENVPPEKGLRRLGSSPAVK